jgi:hypothetical protein
VPRVKTIGENLLFAVYLTNRGKTMSDKELLLQEINTLPADCLGEVVNFVEYIKQKQLRKIPETMRLSEAALAKEWDAPDEDAAWQTL